MTHESIASITRERERERERERRNERKKKVGEKERWRFCFGLAHSFYLFFYLMKLYFSHLDVASANGFILHVDYYFLSSCFFFFFFFEVFFNKDGDFVLV